MEKVYGWTMILKNYVWIGKVFTDQEVARIHEIAHTIPAETGFTGGLGDNDPDAPPRETQGQDTSIRQSTIKWIQDHKLDQSINNKIHEAVGQGSQESGWNFGIEYIEQYQYTIYEHKPNIKQNDHYTWHTDHGGEIMPDGMHRKLSMTIQLSDPDEYEGGHFQWIEQHDQFNQIRKDSKVVEISNLVRTLPFSAKEKGTMILFPSFVHHQVTPVIKGIRKSLVGWCNGYPYV